MASAFFKSLSVNSVVFTRLRWRGVGELDGSDSLIVMFFKVKRSLYDSCCFARSSDCSAVEC